MTTAPHMPAKAHSTDDVHHRPRGILKNSNSYQVGSSAQTPTTPLAVQTVSEPTDTKEITLQNTLQNAGRRRSSSNTQGGSSSRRQSHASAQDENSPRLKWDEANLYLTEQERTAKMKIDEPKTPYAPHYDPTEDEEELRLEEARESLIDAQDVVVDELDKNTKGGHHKKGLLEDDIPDLELGEPEDSLSTAADGASSGDPRIYRERSMSTESHKGEKHVVVGAQEANGGAAPSGDDLMTTEEATEKHRQFEERRKKHYEMKNIKELLAHPEDLDEMEEDDNEPESGPPPPMPQMPERFRRGG